MKKLCLNVLAIVAGISAMLGLVWAHLYANGKAPFTDIAVWAAMSFFIMIIIIVFDEKENK